MEHFDDDDSNLITGVARTGSFASSSGKESGSALDSSNDNGMNEVRRIAKKESKDVEVWRELVTGMLVIASVLVGIGTYVFLRFQETGDFRQAFDLLADSVQEASQRRDNNMRKSLSSISNMITYHAIEKNSTWPFVTIPFFDSDAAHIRGITNTGSISFCPIVSQNHLQEWESFALKNNWLIDAGIDINQAGQSGIGYASDRSHQIFGFEDYAHGELASQQSKLEYTSDTPGPYAPIWQLSPVVPNLINLDILSHPKLLMLYKAMVETREIVFSSVLSEDQPQLLGHGNLKQERMHELMDIKDQDQGTAGIAADPQSIMFTPIFQNPEESSNIVGFLQTRINWKTIILDLSPPQSHLLMVLKNTCGKQYGYHVHSRTHATVLEEGAIPDERWEKYFRKVDLLGSVTSKNFTFEDYDSHCAYQLLIFPSKDLTKLYRTKIPYIFTSLVVGSFFLLALVFFLYDTYVRRRNDKVVIRAARSNAIVSSMFPSSIRDRLFESYETGQCTDATSVGGSVNLSRRSMNTMPGRLKSFLSADGGNSVATDNDDDRSHKSHKSVDSSKPVADLFLNTTVLFGDIVGFTAWSSVREPTHVFTLLETIYRTFDKVAKARRVFKVETVGDCYMAVTGLPDPRPDHAVVMARFACDCMNKMHDISRKLEVTLGPDTGELSMRFGMHSGPVTAGVLRGKRARFQLFGDTVNTASRMESTGHKGRIHISQETASLLEAAGKRNWYALREDKIVAKGKGELTTYWLIYHERCEAETSTQCSKSSSRSNKSTKSASESPVTRTGEVLATRGASQGAELSQAGKMTRLVDWNVEVLARLLKHVMARRRATTHRAKPNDVGPDDTVPEEFNSVELATDGTKTVLEEVREIITLPKFDSKAARNQEDPDLIELDTSVIFQLHDYVTQIASLYLNNPFHNFEHASHVAMSVVKLLSRIVAPSDIDYGCDLDAVSNERKRKKKIASKMHDHTYGITSDPLTQFAVVFSALIHDVGHTGVPNAQLIKENDAIAAHYKNLSVAEQNSVDVSWKILMEPRYSDLRKAIYCNESEFIRFRQLVVNSVMATDIVDKELKVLRNARWDKAFKGVSDQEEDITVATNRKATIVIEHLIQASDVSHTMQHWHIFRKWNERLFMEMYKAYKEGRSDNDPAQFWYKGEIGFFDFYIIPLAKKLSDCGVFGVSSDEYLNYAMKNRDEWEEKGEEVVAEMVASVVSVDF